MPMLAWFPGEIGLAAAISGLITGNDPDEARTSCADAALADKMPIFAVTHWAIVHLAVSPLVE
jgi:hypothetical protein